MGVGSQVHKAFSVLVSSSGVQQVALPISGTLFFSPDITRVGMDWKRRSRGRRKSKRLFGRPLMWRHRDGEKVWERFSSALNNNIFLLFTFLLHGLGSLWRAPTRSSAGPSVTSSSFFFSLFFYLMGLSSSRLRNMLLITILQSWCWWM